MANDSEPIRYASKVSSQNMESIRGREPLSLTARFELVVPQENVAWIQSSSKAWKWIR